MFFTPGYIKDAQERKNLLKKVYYYRRAQLQDSQLQQLRTMATRIGTAIRGRGATKGKKKIDHATQIKQLMAESDSLLATVGGHYYRHYHFFENIETLVVAAILAIGIRSYFLQPFKIPTNSMWPTYHGMTYTIDTTHQQPTLAQKAASAVLQGATHYRVVAPVEGTVRIPVFSPAEREQLSSAFRYRVVEGRMLGIIPIKERLYTWYVGDTPVSLRVPLEFNLDKVIVERFFSADNKPLRLDSQQAAITDVRVRAGEPILSFTLETGDMLFVDRFSYHFVPPAVGASIVFRTRAVEGLTQLNGGTPDDKYYIKRLVGLPGDYLSIQDSTLLRNGTPITGSPIFNLNAQKIPPYAGYQAQFNFADSQKITVPQGHYFAMGDNSPESLDSRVWGGLPQNQVVGRAVFIYYPFTPRWGPSR